MKLTEAEREALRASGSWPHVETDLFAAVEAILAARLAKVEALADRWGRLQPARSEFDNGRWHRAAASALRAALDADVPAEGSR